ncbi:MAG: cell division protein DivIVA, partial [Planctomycetota bacterium]|nr:cell division protein DivIVA [Planctomycetota bacterium]
MEPPEGPAAPPGPGRSPTGDPVRERVLEIAHDVGFDLAGIAPWGPPPDAARFEAWLDEGRHGSMGYLERGRAAA